MLIVFTTITNGDEAAALAKDLVDKRLAVCVQVLPQMTSFYLWDGEMQQEPEHLLLIKTLPERYDELERFISENHSYETPEIVAVDAARVSGPYLEWIKGLLA